MARQSKADQLAQIHADAIAEFDEIQKAVADERQQCLEDRRFYSIAGAQYEGELAEQFANRPKFEFNRTHLAVLRIINEYRNNRVTVDFTSKDGSDDDETADTCDGLYRADEKASGREFCDNAFEEAAGGGMGAWRLHARYEDEYDDENTQQRIRLAPIHDAESRVFFDLDAKTQDKSDAKRCYLLTPISRSAYEEQYEDDPADWPKSVTNAYFDWCTPDVVWLCELYKVEEVGQMVYWYRGLALSEDEPNEKRVTQDELDADPEMADQLYATGFRLDRQKRVKTRKIRKFIMSGGGILEDCGYLPGTEIPIVVTYGKRWVVDGVERFMGHVRLAKDAQRLTNMLMSWLAEIASRFDMEKPIFAPEQIAKHAHMWANDNIERFAYLLADPIKDKEGNVVQNGPIGYTKAPNVPPAMAALMEIATQALNDLLGGQQAGEQLQPNLSGKAVELIQNRLDMQVFIYMDNFAQYGMRRCGQIWLSMMRDLVVEKERRMKTVAADDKAGSVVVNQPVIDQKTGEKRVKNDMTKATFDVDVDVGPSSSSKRAATVRALTGIATTTDDPETKQALTFSTIANLEGEGLGDLRDWARARAVRMGIMKPTEEEKQELSQEQANQQPDPQSAYLLAEAEKSKADTGLKAAQTEKAKADTAATLAGIDADQRQQAIDAAKTILDVTNQHADRVQKMTGF